MAAGEPGQTTRKGSCEPSIITGRGKIWCRRAAACIENIGLDIGQAEAAPDKWDKGLIFAPDDVGVIVDQEEIDAGIAGKGLVAIIETAAADIGFKR